MGVLAPVSEHAWHSAQPPIVTSGILLLHVTPVNILKTFSDQTLATSGYSKYFSFFLNKPKNHPTSSTIFLWVKTPCKFQNPRTAHFERKVTWMERKKDAERHLIEATTFHLQRPRSGHGHCLDQNNYPCKDCGYSEGHLRASAQILL